MPASTRSFDFKSKWNLFAATGVVIFAEIVSFMVAPPQLRFDENSRIDFFVKFLLAALIALLAIPMLRKSRKADHAYWYRFSWVAIVGSLLALGLYMLLLTNWSVPYYNGIRLVTGKTMTTEAQRKKSEVAQLLNLPAIDDETFVKSRKGQVELIWNSDELRSRYFLFSVLYVLCFLLFALFMLSVIQAIYCYEQE